MTTNIIYQSVTDSIIKKLEDAKKWEKPWFDVASQGACNIASKKAYRGINLLILDKPGYYGTYKQWQEKKCQVKKGEKATRVVFWKIFDKETDIEEETKKVFMLREYCVFHSSQVDGFIPTIEPELSNWERIERCSMFVTKLYAKIEHGFNQACYYPDSDIIHMPRPSQFTTQYPAYYSTLFHELTHWTGKKERCNRNLTGRFGTDSYAMEELVAELGASYLCAHLGVDQEPRQDHANYISSWLTVLKRDNRAIFSAASQAQKAVDYMCSLQQQEERLAA